MDSGQAPSFEIPKTPEIMPVPATSVEKDPSLALEGPHEILPAPMAQPQSPTPIAPYMQATAPVNPGQPQPIGLANTDDPQVADDVDVMEKEWVERAKKVIAATINDPYVETKELHKLKAVYMKKRFNKDLLIADDGGV